VVEDDKAVTVLNALILIFWTDTQLLNLSIITYLHNSDIIVKIIEDCTNEFPFGI
jgi:hypothetical protein